MSPEQAQGLPVDARSDIFSLGSVLYELVTGRRAFRAESQAATLAAVLRDEPAPLETWPALQEVVFRCLRKSAADRFETAAALEIALRRIPAQPVSRQPSIAVLPFRNLSADPDNEYFSDGLAEEIIGALAQIPGLKVIARSSAFAFKGKPEDVRRVAEILGVGHILEGSVRRAGSRIRVTAQLIAASDGSHLWSQRYDREMTDIFAIQDDISQAIAGALRVTLIAPQRRSASLQAYENYLNGTYHCQRNTPDGLAKAQVFFEQALAIDPGYALAHAGLASYYFNLAGLAIQPGREIMSLAKLAAERAVAIDPALNEARSVLGVAAATLDYDWELAEHEFRVATAASPVPSWVRFRFAYFLLVPRGRLAEASEQFRLILETDPLFQLAYYGESFTRCMQGDYGGALQRCAQALDLDANSWLAYLVKGLAELGTGRAGESVSSLERCRQLAPWNTTSIGYLACSYVTAGLPERAERLLDESLRHWSNTDLALARAFYHGARGEVDRMFECLEKAFADRNVLLSSVWWQAPFRSYEADPRCQALLRAMNLR